MFFYEFPVPEVTYYHQELLLPQIEGKTRSVRLLKRGLAIEADHPCLATLESDGTAVLGCLDCLFVCNSGWFCFFLHRKQSTHRIRAVSRYRIHPFYQRRRRGILRSSYARGRIDRPRGALGWLLW